MTEYMDKWPSKHRKTEKSGHRMAAEGVPFSWLWNCGTISTKLNVIWGMSVYTHGVQNCSENLVHVPVVVHNQNIQLF